MAALTPGARLGNRFTLHGVVGRGGSATVWLAHDALRDHTVALKVVHPHLAQDPAVARRLRREVEAATLLHGEAVLAPHDLHALDGHLALSMPFHDGHTLAEHVARRGPMPLVQLEALGLRIAGALAEAHGTGVLHRDVTPTNIMLQDSGHDAVLTDFGLARTQQTARTRSTGLLGTAGYAAPEVYEGSRADPRSDLYGLGACLYLAATAKAPFSSDNPVSALKAQLDDAYTPLSELRPNLPAPMRVAIESMLSCDPDARPAGAAEVRDLLAGRALPPAPKPRAADSVRRQYLPPGSWTVVVEERGHDRHRRQGLRRTRRGRRTTESELHRIGQGFVQGLKSAFGVQDEPDAAERQLAAAVAEEAGLGSDALRLPRVVYDKRFRLVHQTDEATARRLAAAAEALGFKARVQDLGRMPSALDLLARWFWVVIAVGWATFPFGVGIIDQLVPGIGSGVAMAWIALMTVVSIVLPIYATNRKGNDPRTKELPSAWSAALTGALTDGEHAPPRYAIASNAPVPNAVAPRKPAPPVALPTRAEALHARASDALDALEAGISEHSDQLPAPAISDLRSTARDLRRAADDLLDEARRIDAALEGQSVDDSEAAALQARLDRLHTLAAAGQAVDAGELRSLERTLASHEREARAIDELESGRAAVDARLLEICSTAHHARRGLVETRPDRSSADEAVARLRREVAAARRAVKVG